VTFKAIDTKAAKPGKISENTPSKDRYKLAKRGIHSQEQSSQILKANQRGSSWTLLQNKILLIFYMRFANNSWAISLIAITIFNSVTVFVGMNGQRTIF